MSIADLAWIVIAFIDMAAALLFLVGYDFKTGGDWKHHRMGCHIMGLMASIGLCLALIAWTIAAGPVARWVWILALAALGYFLIERCYMLFSKRWHEPVEDVDDASDDTIRARREFRG